MNVLITGGAGFIGSHLAERLLERGDSVLVIDNFATGRRDNLRAREGLEIVEGSVADGELVRALFERFRPEVVVHAAASYKDPSAWAEDVRTNVLGSAHVARTSQEYSVSRLIYFQTSLCYGLHPDEQPITLGHAVRPAANSYAVSKTAGEGYVEMAGVDYISFRLANAYGPRNVSGPLPTFYQRLSSGKPCFVADTRRDFIFIEDLTEVVVKAIDGWGRRGPYHISTGSDYSIKELYDATVAALGVELDDEVAVRPRGPDDAYTILIDPSATCRDFQWKAHTPLEEGVRRTVEYYRRSGVTETFTHLRLKDEGGEGQGS